jgi:hypothetical protein
MAEPPSEISTGPDTGSKAKVTSSAPGAESPRTGREPDFDDDVPETAHLPAPERQPTPQKRVSFQDEVEEVGPAPPPKPPRPMSPQAKAEVTLIEAFPSIDAKVVKAVLVASNGKVEPAFNALLGMSDPEYVHDTGPPPPSKNAPRRELSQLEADEQYARQLAEQYDTRYSGSSYDGFGSPNRGNPPLANRRGTGLKPNELYDKEHSFMDGKTALLHMLP